MSRALTESVDRYLDYWCFVEIITPERTVLPGLHILAKGDNVTSGEARSDAFGGLSSLASAEARECN